MAEVVRFVLRDGINTAGGNGTTSNNTGANRAYESISEWEAAEETNLPVDTDTHVLFCSGANSTDTGNLHVQGWTGDATFFLTMNGEVSTLGEFDETKYHFKLTTVGQGENIFDVFPDNTIMNDFQCEVTTAFNQTEGFHVRSNDAFNNRCIVKGVLTGTLTYCQGFEHDPPSPGGYRSCLVYDWTGPSTNVRAFFIDNPTSPAEFLNCTMVRGDLGYRTENAGANDSVAKNCLAQKCTTGFNNLDWDETLSANNCSDISAGDPPGVNSFVATVDFGGSRGARFRPWHGDTKVTGKGVDLSADFNFDLTNQPWVVPTIGCLNREVLLDVPFGPMVIRATGKNKVLPIAWEKSISESLEFAYLGVATGGRAYDHVKGLFGVPANAARAINGQVEFTSSPSDDIRFGPNSPKIDETRPFTIIVRVYAVTGGDPIPLTFDHPNSDGAYHIGLSDNDSYAPWYVGSRGTGGPNMLQIQPGRVTDNIPLNEYHTYCVTFDGVDEQAISSHRLYYDGHAEIDLETAAGFQAGTTNEIQLGGFNNSSQFDLNGSISYAIMWRRALAPGEVYAMYMNPHQILQNQTIYIGEAPELDLVVF